MIAEFDASFDFTREYNEKRQGSDAILNYDHKGYSRVAKNVNSERVKESFFQLVDGEQLEAINFYEISWEGTLKSAYMEIKFEKISEAQFEAELDSDLTRKSIQNEKEFKHYRGTKMMESLSGRFIY